MKSKVYWRNTFFSFGMICFLMLLISACTPGNGPAPTSATKSWGTAALIETDNAGGAINPQVAFDASGNAVAVWQQSDGTRYHILSNRYTASTKSWGTAALIETDNTGDASNPQIAIDANGNAVVVWQKYNGDHNNIWSSRYSASAASWSTPTYISNGVGSAVNPQVAFDADGNAVAVWYQDDGNTNIWSNRYTASTGLWGTAALIETNGGYAYNPQVAIDANGNAIVVWYQDVGYPYHIWSNRYTASTGLWSGAAPIQTDPSGNAIHPQVAIDASGNAVAVWQQYDDVGNRYNIWSNRYTASTGLWGTAVLIETDDAGWATQPQVAFDASGNAVAVWQQSDGTRYNIWSNRYTAGIGWGTATLIETDNAGDAINPQVAFDASGNAVVVWQQSDGTRYNIWSNRYTASTGLWGTAALIETDNAGDANNPQVAIDASGNALAVWSQSDGTRYNIWSNMYR